MKQARVLRAIVATLFLIATVACGAGQVDPRTAQHEARVKKAAGVASFRIVCVKDLWERTSDKGFADGGPSVTGKVTSMPNDMVAVDLSGPQLVDYLERLHYDGFFGSSDDPLSIRMYNGIAPVVDKIQPGAPGGEVPEVRIDDPVGSATSTPAATPTSS